MKTNVASPKVYTNEGAPAQRVGPTEELRRAVMTCMLWEDSFYEIGSSIATRIEELCKLVEPNEIAKIAVDARDKMYLRHVPLYLVRQLARRSKEYGIGAIVEQTLYHVVQRADELAEFMAMYWKDDPPTARQSLGAGVKRGLAAAFTKFNEYQLAKYDRAGVVRLRDVMFLVHPKPRDAAQAETFKRLANQELATPDTWEVELSAGKDKKATFERLLREGKLGGMAVLRNLRNMIGAGVQQDLIQERLSQGIAKALPFRFVTAARYAPQLEDAIEQAMFVALEGQPALPGRTGLLVDVSGSMDAPISNKSETTRVDAAAGLAILLRERAERADVATFSSKLVIIPPRRGFALRDAIATSQPHGATNTGAALTALQGQWHYIDRLIVITDEQSHDMVPAPWCKQAYMVNVAPYQHGVGYGNGWTHINGWSERVVDYIRESEAYEGVTIQ